METQAALETTATSFDAQLINDAISSLNGASGSKIAMVAVIINLVTTMLRNMDKIMFLKVLGVNKLIKKINPEIMALVITGLTVVTMVLTNSDQPIGNVISEAVFASLSAIGIHESSKPLKKKMKIK